MKKIIFVLSAFLPIMCTAQQNVVSYPQLEQLQNKTYIYAIIVAIVALALSFLLANIIPHEGGADGSYIKRRIGYIIILLLQAFGFYIYNATVVSDKIINPGYRNMFEKTNFICLGVTIGVYLVGSLIVMLCFRRSKYGSILGKVKD